MNAVTHHVRVFLISALLSLLALALLARPAHSAWSAAPVQVQATSALCPLVGASDDSHYGAILTWQENTGSGGVLKAQHLLSNGDMDSGWPAPVDVCTAAVTRTALGSVSDDVGGAYVWWMESAQLYLTRVSPSGAIALGWPVRGRVLATLFPATARPAVVKDGSGGLYIAWLGGTVSIPTFMTIRVMHLGPANTGKGGWINGVRSLGGTQFANEEVNSFAIEAAPDGGLWLAFATSTLGDPDLLPGDVRVARYTSAGTPAAGWDPHGVSLAMFRGDLLAGSRGWGLTPASALVAVANDGGTGAFVVHGDPADNGGGNITPSFRLSRIDGAGATPSG